MVKLSYYSNLGIEDFSKLGLVWNLFANFGKHEKGEIISQSRNGSIDRFDFTDRLIEKAAAGVSIYHKRISTSEGMIM